MSLSVCVLTYNLAQTESEEGLFSFLPRNYDIYALGFQEVGPFVPVMCNKNQDRLTILLNTHFGDDYCCITNMEMLGLKLYVTFKKSIENHIQSQHEFTIPTGADGIYGNKGALAVSLLVYDNPFLFICAHFAAHESETEKRNQNYKEIMQQIQIFSGLPVMNSHSFIFFYGDLNYRIMSTYEDVKKASMAGRYEYLLSHDQLNKEKNLHKVFQGFSEPEIQFPPTYRFDKNSLIYDTSAKSRVPSYTDRILFYSKSRKRLQVIAYSADMNILLSDHRPVIGLFRIDTSIELSGFETLEPTKRSTLCRI